MSVNCQTYRKSGLTVRKLHAVTDPKGKNGRSSLMCQCCHGTQHYRYVCWVPFRLSRSLHSIKGKVFPFKNSSACAHAHVPHVRLQGLCVRCKCAGTQLSRRRWGEKGGSARGSKGVNWAVIVKEAGSDWVKWQDLVHSTWDTLTAFCSFYLSSIIFFLFVDHEAFILGWAFEM